MVLASDNLTYLPTPELTIREQPFHTKHLPASYVSRPYTLSSRQFNTLMDLNHFDYDMCYIPGAKNVVADDRLSRRADHNTSQAALLVTEITDAGHVSEDHVQEDHVQKDHVQEDHVQEDHVQQDHVQEDHVQEDHVQEGHVPAVN
jgi:pentapeptide MXKDX repeat protein